MAETSSQFSVKGLSELQKFLDQLPVKMEANIMRGALRAGAKIIEAAAKANAPVSPPANKNFGGYAGALRDSIRTSVRIRRGKVTASVKAGGKNKRTGADVFYASMVEFGTRPHLISVQEDEKNINLRRSAKFGKIMKESMTTINRRVLKIGNTFIGPTVKHPGSQPRPFMRPALDGQAQNAVVAAAEYIKKRLTKEGLNAADVEISTEDNT